MAKTKRANEPHGATIAQATDGPAVLGDLLGTSRDRGPGNGTRIEPVPAPPVSGAPVPPPPPAVAATSAAPSAGPSVPTVSPGSDPAPDEPSAGGPGRKVVSALVFAAIAGAGVYVGVRSDSVGDALRTVSVVLVATAVLIYLAAFVLWIRSRGRAAMADSAPAPPRADASVPPAEAAATTAEVAGAEPRVPTLAEVAAELDAVSGAAPASTPAPVAPAVPAPAVPVIAEAPVVIPPPPAATVPPPPAPVVPPPPAPAMADFAAGEPPVPVVDRPASVLDAIAPYTQVVGTPVIRDLPAAAPADAPSIAEMPAVPGVPPPPPPRAVVPPPPPPPRTVVPPPPPAVPSAPPAATTAAEVFAAMTAGPPVRGAGDATTEPAGPPPIEAIATTAGRAPAPGTVTRPDAAELVDLFADDAAAAELPIDQPSIHDPSVGPADAAPVDVTGPVDAPGDADRSDRSDDRAPGDAALVRSWVPPVPSTGDGQGLAHLAGADVAARSAVGSVAPVVVYRYRKWVLGQMTPGNSFGPVDVDRSPDEWLLLATCGVATLLAWTHEDHHFTYPVQTWVDEILPAHGVRIRDNELAHDLIMAAALHAGGVDSVPTERLRSYAPSDLVTAMASIHVGLLRLYCGLGHIEPERVLADQYGIGPGDIPLH